MIRLLKFILRKFNIRFFKNTSVPVFLQDKYRGEIEFWKDMIVKYVQWYDGKIEKLFGELPPVEQQKVKTANITHSALLTWQKVHQQPKYAQDLQLPVTAFEGLKVLDVGSGPHPSGLVFTNCEVYNLDPLLPLYIEAGYPVHIYDPRAKFVYGFSERMPFEDNFFDAVISANALDHVDDFNATAGEIKRVLKPGGKLRVHLHFHPATLMEPLEINAEIVTKAFSWCDGFKKISESKSKKGSVLTGADELYSVWSNF